MSEVPITDQAPPALVEIPTDSCQDAGQGKEVETSQGKDKSKDKGKGKTSDTHYLSARTNCWSKGSQGTSLGH